MPESKYFRLCRLSCNYSTLPGSKKAATEYIETNWWLYSRKTLFVKTGSWLIWPKSYSLSTSIVENHCSLPFILTLNPTLDCTFSTYIQFISELVSSGGQERCLIHIFFQVSMQSTSYSNAQLFTDWSWFKMWELRASCR